MLRLVLVFSAMLAGLAPAPLRAQSTPGLTLKSAPDTAPKRDLKVEGSGDAPAKVEVRGWDPANKKAILGKGDGSKAGN